MKAEGARNALLDYDPLGRLWRVWDPTTAASSATQFVYDGDRLILETNDAGAPRHFYVHGNAPDQPLIWWDFTGTTNNTRRFLHADQQGSIVAASNGQTGAIATIDNVPAINRYDPWGVPGAGNMENLRFGYTGQAWIPELQMYYYKARFYYPALGRFLQTDPVGYADQVNLYAYVGDDPANHVDPSGKCPDACIVEGAVAACAATQVCTAGAIAVGTGIVYYGGKFVGWIASHMSKDKGSADEQAREASAGAKAPRGNQGEGRPHGSREHNAEIDRQAQGMRGRGYTDIRKNQSQVDANGNKVGRNRPDLQGTNPETGQREHVEVDRDPRRAQQHEIDILRNDPQAQCTLIRCPR